MTAVLHSTPVWLPQTQTWMYNQIRYLPDGIDAHVTCERTENLDQFQVPNIHCLADGPALRYYWEKGLRKLGLRRHLAFQVESARRNGAEILHSHFGPVGWSDIGVARRAGMKHVVTFYGQDVNFLPQHAPVWRERYLELFDRVDLVLCEGPHMARCIEALGCPQRKIEVQRLGIAIAEIPFAPLERQPGGTLKVLIAATFREKKGIPYALEALGALKKKVRLEITVIGDAGADPREATEKEMILAAIDKHHLLENTRLLGFQPHARLMEEAGRHHIFLSPSVTAADGDTEGGAPVSLIEMSAAGMIMVSTTHCDIPQIINHKETGLLAEERDVGGLIENLDWLLAHTDRWGAMRRAARTHVEANFDAATQGTKLAAIYMALAGSRSGRTDPKPLVGATA